MASPDTSAACALIQPGTELVRRHMQYMERMVAVDSRSFNVNEFEGDRTEPTDMHEILELTTEYLKEIGFDFIQINQPPELPYRATPILMAGLHSSDDKPTVLLYAHLDKQPYMDDGRFEKWGGVSPTQLRWNEEGTRAYGRGAADDLSGVIAIGMAVDALLKSFGPETSLAEVKDRLPCNLKIIFETEEESGSVSLIDQILQNRSFFETADCVIITDVLNPDTGIPGLTTSLRGIQQMQVKVTAQPGRPLDDQCGLYRLLARLIKDDHSLAVDSIAQRDIVVTDAERDGYSRIPIALEDLCEMAGLLPNTRLVVPDTLVDVIQSQLRISYANVRPGHRVAGGVIFGAAGCRLSVDKKPEADEQSLAKAIQEKLQAHNPFSLRIVVRPVADSANTSFDILVQSSTKDPHSGVIGGPFPVAELQLARMMTALIDDGGRLNITECDSLLENAPARVRALHVENDLTCHLFEDPSAEALVEIRLAPGNDEASATQLLETFLRDQVPDGFSVELTADKGGTAWMTDIKHPAFPLMLDCLEQGFGTAPCLYGCGGSIPFVAKLMDALGPIPPLCLGAYDPDCKMHEPGESLSMVDLLGCTRSIVHFLARSPQAFSP